MTKSGRSIELFFHDGDPEGMTTATIPFQWTGHVLVTSRTQVTEALAEPEAAQPGIYILSGEKDGVDTIYVGETDEIRARIKQHIQAGTKDWWDKAIFVTATGEPLNKAHSRFLESRIYSTAKSTGKVGIDNSLVPTESPLSKAATAHMEDFLDKLKLVLPALKFDFLSDQMSPASRSVENEPDDDIKYFVLKSTTLTARAWKEGSKFFVAKGSDAREDWVGESTRESSYGRLYRDLVTREVIGDQGGKRAFLKDYGFKSVSAAAAVIYGRPASGTDAWRLAADEAVSFGDYEKMLVEQTNGEAGE